MLLVGCITQTYMPVLFNNNIREYAAKMIWLVVLFNTGSFIFTSNLWSGSKFYTRNYPIRPDIQAQSLPFSPFQPILISHYLKLDQSISVLKVCGGIFHFNSIFNEALANTQWRTRSDDAYCGIWAGSALHMHHKKRKKKREHSGSVVECLSRDQRAAGSRLTGVTALWYLSKTHLSYLSTGSTLEDPSLYNWKIVDGT